MKLKSETTKFFEELDNLCLRHGIAKIKIDGDSVYFYHEDGLDFVSFMKYDNGEYHGVEESSLVSTYSARTGEGYVD